MNILAIDSSTEVLSLALSASGKVWHTEINAGTRHSELMQEWTALLVESAGLEPSDLDLVVCMKGPGSFTGLRIGFAAAKGLSLALGIPVAAVPTLDCMALPHAVWPGIVLPVMDAKKSCFFAAFYRGNNRLSEYLDQSPDALVSTLNTLRSHTEEPLLITGPGSELFLSRIPLTGRLGVFAMDPLAGKGKSQEILNFLEKHTIFDYEEGLYSGPLYLRKSDAELSITS